jgi:hypothetical protein
MVKVGSFEMRAHEDGPSEMRIFKVGSFEIRAHEEGLSQNCTAQIETQSLLDSRSRLCPLRRMITVRTTAMSVRHQQAAECRLRAVAVLVARFG